MFSKIDFIDNLSLPKIQPHSELLFGIFVSLSIHILFLFLFKYGKNGGNVSVAPVSTHADPGQKSSFYMTAIVLPVAPRLTQSPSERASLPANALSLGSNGPSVVLERGILDDDVDTEVQAGPAIEALQPDPSGQPIQSSELGKVFELQESTQNWQAQPRGGVFTRAMNRRQHAANSQPFATNLHASQDAAFQSVQFLETLTHSHDPSSEQKFCQLNSHGASCEFPWMFPAAIASQWRYWALRGLAPGHLLVNTSNLLLGNQSP